MTRRKDAWSIVTIGVFLIYIFFLLYPLLTLLAKSVIGPGGNFTLDAFQKFFSSKYYYGTIVNSLKVTFCVTILTVLIAVPLAYILNTVKIHFAPTIQILILISSTSAPFIGAYSWILLLGRNGVITNFFKNILHIQTPDIYGFTGILLVLTLQLTPLIYMYVSGALKTVDSSLIEAAESMQCTGIRKMMKITAPLILPTILAGSLLVFMRALADFGTPMLIGEGYRTIPVLIFNEFISEMGEDDSFAAAVSIMVVIFATTIFLVQKFIAEKKAYTMTSLRPIQPKKEKGIRNIAAHAFVYIYIILAIMPQAYVIYTSFLKTNGRIFVKGFSFNSYITAFSKIGDAITNTIFLALAALIIIIVIASLIAYVTVRRPTALTNILDISTMFPYIVPGSILGIALLVTFNKKPFFLSGTAFILILAFAIRRLPYTIRSSSAILHQISVSTEEAAINLGASKFKTFIRITVPAMLPGIISGAILSWVSILTELSTSVLLYTTRTRTMTIAIYSEVLRGNYGVAAALSSILSCLTVISLLIFFKLTGKRELSM
ncbi:iron ABC transporter permease [Spirochaetia bacterium]|nr:iron ABC transporter permease [Spirochaetia bacterium]GHU31306.1 iron ABC transporter permease [Spirochaetia bacterium]